MVDKTKLRDMLDSLIDDKGDQAKVDFHSYLENKMKEVITPVADVDVDVDVEKDGSE